MPAPRVLPEPDELVRMVRRGLTQQQIADEVFRRTGVRVTRNAISAALARIGYPKLRPRYEDLIPWRVKPEHGRHYALRMLRTEARRRNGEQLTDMEVRRLESWKELLAANKAVVHYEPATVEGFFYVPARPGVDTDLIYQPDVAAEPPAS